MYTSQIIFFCIIVFIIYRTIINVRKKYVSKIFIVFWFLLWSFILFILFDQKLLTKIANLIGIVRGVDLAMYISVITIFYLLFTIFLKIQKIEKILTIIIRENTLKQYTNEK